MISLKPTSNGKECGCKGIRTCLLCRPQNCTGATNSHSLFHHTDNSTQVQSSRSIYQYCLYCQKGWLKGQGLAHVKQLPVGEKLDEGVLLERPCCHEGGETSRELQGIHITENFVTREEESTLDKAISCTPFLKSQSGRQKQDFGPKVNFKKQKLKLGPFSGLPSYSRFLYQRMKACKVLEDFEPVEMCNLEYTSDRGAHIDPHFDDSWIWGERLVTLNLLSDSVLSFTHDLYPDIVIQVPLLCRSLLVVSGPARYEWKHSIDSEHISGRRLAMTFRELSDEFKNEGARSEEGQELLKLALSFEGSAVGCAS